MYKKIVLSVILSMTLLQSGCIVQPSNTAPTSNVDPGKAPIGNVEGMPGQI